MVKTIIVHFWTLPKKEAEDQMKAILKEAKATYLKDAGTLDWLVMQDPKDSTAWSIVERYQDEAAFNAHFANPYYKKFMADVGPITDSAKETQILIFEEL
ncbi:hypothetical protein B0H14DRAFT_1318967 [Mycena olivaceomarginata]|nr:hypothetical protein B0H14DRAFT_1318967 [Mycena olivaceomarginata]